jgi:hypothetical protein
MTAMSSRRKPKRKSRSANARSTKGDEQPPEQVDQDYNHDDDE